MTVRQPDAERPRVAANGYRVVLPPGWVRIPLRHGTERALEDLVFARLKQLPAQVSKDDGMKYRLAVRRSVARRVAEARGAGGLDLCLPVTTRYGIPLAASFLVSEHVMAAPLPPEALLAGLAPAEGAEIAVRELAGMPVVRREHVSPPQSELDLHVATRRVEYALPTPNDPRRMLSVAFSTPGDGDVDSDFTKAVTELFDASMLTFRWTRDGLELAPGSVTESGTVPGGQE